MSTIAMNTPSVPSTDTVAGNLGNFSSNDDVVEVGLLLPAPWAKALIDLSQRRQQSVAQLLRSVIGRALNEGD